MRMDQNVFKIITHQLSMPFEEIQFNFQDIHKEPGSNGLMQILIADISLVFGNFLENHDTNRFAHLSGDISLSRNALAFLMMLDGIPVINQGQEQRYSGANDPYNREPVWTSDYNTDAELYQWIARLNQVRSFIIGEDCTYASSKASVIFNSTHAIGMKKADAITVATNAGLGASKTNITLAQSNTGYSPSNYYIDVLSCDLYKTTGNGSLNLELGSEPKIFYPAKALRAAGWECEKLGTSIASRLSGE